MLILPGDRVGIRFGSEAQPFEAIRMQPDIHSDKLPEPFKSRYQTPSGVRLPCNDVMIADSMKCEETVIYCTSGDQQFGMHIVGAGEEYHLERKCSDFFADDFKWDIEQKILDTDTSDFINKYHDGNDG